MTCPQKVVRVSSFSRFPLAGDGQVTINAPNRPTFFVLIFNNIYILETKCELRNKTERTSPEPLFNPRSFRRPQKYRIFDMLWPWRRPHFLQESEQWNRRKIRTFQKLDSRPISKISEWLGFPLNN